MPRIPGIVDQLQRAWDGDPFHGPALRAILDGVGAEAAFARPLAGAHTIAELALHIATWEDVVQRRLGGELIDSLPDDQDWPPVREETPAAWEAVQRRLEDAHARL